MTKSDFPAADLWTHFLDPMRAVVRLRLGPLEGGVEVRGRLMGPRCPFASTVEVAYPFRPVAGSSGTVFEAVIPEPSLWEPACPFLYEGPIETWESGEPRGKIWVSHGLRTIVLGPGGLILNGRPCPLRGITLDDGTEAELLQLRRGGCNLLLAPAERTELWKLASRLGFLMLARLDASNARDPGFRNLHKVRSAATLGWIMPEDFAHSPRWRAMLAEFDTGDHYGLYLSTMPSRPLPKEIKFLLASEGLADELRPLNMAIIVCREGELALTSR